MKFKQSHILLFFLVVIITSCRKDYFKPKWDVDVSTPLVKTNLSLDNFFPDSIIETQDDSSLILHLDNINYNAQIESFDDLFDTTFNTSFPDIPFSTKVPPGYRYISSLESDIGAKGLELKKILVKSGKVKFSAKSTITEITYMTYEIKNTINVDNEEPAILEDFKIPAGDIGKPSNAVTYFDISNYEFDLRGESLVGFNTILSEVDVRINHDGDSCVVGSKSKIELTISFEDVILEIGRGYLGKELLVLDNNEIDLGILKNIKEGEIKLDDVELNLSIKNYLGADLKSVINDLYVVSISGNKEELEHNELGKILNFSRAKEVGDLLEPSIYNINFNKDNSNILDIFEALPSKVGFKGKFELNPLGNISNGNDFIYFDKTIGVEMDLTLPLKVGINGLKLLDSIVFDFDKNERLKKVNEGRLMIIAENMFPVDASIKMHFLSKSGKLLETVKGKEKILAGKPEKDGKVVDPVKSRVTFDLDRAEYDNFRKTKILVLEAVYNTKDHEMVQFYEGYNLQLTLVADFNYEIDSKTIN